MMSLDRLLSESSAVERTARRLGVEVGGLDADLELAKQLVFSSAGKPILERMIYALRDKRDDIIKEIPSLMGAAQFREAVTKLSNREKFLVDAVIKNLQAEEAYRFVADLFEQDQPTNCFRNSKTE